MNNQIENKLSYHFTELIRKHDNGRWATNELEYLCFVKHKQDLENSGSEWIVRNYILALREIYGEKQEGDL